MNGGLYRASHICPHCRFEHPNGKKTPKGTLQQSVIPPEPISASAHIAEPAITPATTESVAAIATPKPTTATTPAPAKPANPKPTLAVTPTAKPAAPATVKPKTALATVSKPTAKTGSAPKLSASNASSATQATNSPQAQAATQAAKTDAASIKAAQAKPVLASMRVPAHAPKPKLKKTGVNVALTANPSHELNILKLFEEVSATCVLNIELTADLFIKGKFAGVKSPKIQATLNQGKKDALGQLRKTAQDLGANVVADIEVKNAMKMVDQHRANITVNISGTALLTDKPETIDNTKMAAAL